MNAENANRSADGGCLKRVVLRCLVPMPSIIMWLVAWRIVMPEHAPLWRVACGWLMVWTGVELYNWLKAKSQNVPDQLSGDSNQKPK